MLTASLLLACASTVLFWLALRQMRRAASWWAGRAMRIAESDLSQMFVFIPASRLMQLTLLIAAAAAVASRLMGLPWILLPAVAACALCLPRLWVQWLRSRWSRRLNTQLPDALALWAGLLRAGQGTVQALTQVAMRQASPLGDELRLVVGELRLGVPLEAAFAGLRDRAALQDLRLLSTLLGTHRELGGNLAESLQRLAELLRGRLLMESRIQSLTAQGRLQGVVVGALPVLLLMVLYVMEPQAMQVLHTTWQGWMALAFMVVLEVAGFVLIRRIVRIQI